MVAFKDNKVLRSNLITRRAGLVTDMAFLPGLVDFGPLLASTNGAANEVAGLVSRSRAVLPGNDCEHLYN